MNMPGFTADTCISESTRGYFAIPSFAPSSSKGAIPPDIIPSRGKSVFGQYIDCLQNLCLDLSGSWDWGVGTNRPADCYFDNVFAQLAYAGSVWTCLPSAGIKFVLDR
jgi:hypothetical protein